MYQKELNFAIEIVKEAFQLHVSYRSKGRDKGSFDTVTSNDLAIERFLISKIQEAFPTDNIQSEETRPDVIPMGRTWVIDPIDGTVNVDHIIPLYGIQICLFEHGEPVASLISLPTFRKTFTSIKGEGAFCGKKPLKVKARSLNQSIVSFGDFPHARPDDANKEFGIIEKLASQIMRVRMFGAASIDFAFLAAGKTDGAILFTKNLWDIGPGFLLAKEAGASFYNLSGKPYHFGDSVIVGVNNKDILKTLS
jgi:myo-inositol-1(or 4)-monophosphatase